MMGSRSEERFPTMGVTRSNLSPPHFKIVIAVFEGKPNQHRVIVAREISHRHLSQAGITCLGYPIHLAQGFTDAPDGVLAFVEA
jgi:hypothetical protein